MFWKELLQGKYRKVEDVDFNRINELLLDIMEEYDKQKLLEGKYNYVEGMFEITHGVAKLHHEKKETSKSGGEIFLEYLSQTN